VLSRGIASLLLLALGCGEPAGPERFGAAGKVTLDGTPLHNASVVFEPRLESGVVTTAPIVNGEFMWSADSGPTAGEYDVRINPHAVEEAEALAIMQQKKRQPIEQVKLPPRYQRPGALSATITADGPNHFEFQLKSK